MAPSTNATTKGIPMSVTDTEAVTYATVTHSLYRDVHKGIRGLLFSVTGDAGRLDPADDNGRAELATRVHTVVELLVAHAEHEDRVIQPAAEIYAPEVAARLVKEHIELEERLVELAQLADAATTAPRTEQRTRTHRLYFELASFTGAFLEHMDVEEREIMPVLEAELGVPAVMEMHVAITSSIPPDVMAKALTMMLPAMNIDDRTEMLGGMRQSAPPQVFEGVWGLAGTVLAPSDHRALAIRLGIRG
jgi:iron-sulfur cluster repair protein YtfE (RIC family)